VAFVLDHVSHEPLPPESVDGLAGARWGGEVAGLGCPVEQERHLQEHVSGVPVLELPETAEKQIRRLPRRALERVGRPAQGDPARHGASSARVFAAAPPGRPPSVGSVLPIHESWVFAPLVFTALVVVGLALLLLTNR